MARRTAIFLQAALLLAALSLLTLDLRVPESYAATFGQSTVCPSLQTGYADLMMGTRFSLAETGGVTSLSVYLDGAPTGNVKVAIYDDAANVPNTLKVQSSSSAVSGVGWATVSVPQTTLSAGNYWLLVIASNAGSRLKFCSGGSSIVKSLSFSSAFPSSWGGGGTPITATYSIYATYSTGADFSISANPTSQNIAAGSTASFPLNLAASGGFSGTVNLSVTSGCPSGVTCTVNPTSVNTYPSSSTLSVPTLITTTGSYSVVVTATNGSITHTVTVTVSVTAPNSYNFNVRPGATQIVVTVSWTGTATVSVTIAGPGGLPTMSESSGVIYDRTSIAVSGSTTTTSNIHRVTFAIPPPGSSQAWTLLLSISGTSNYNVAVEVS